MSARDKTTRLGNEYDAPLLEALKATIMELGGAPRESWWGVAGSQEIASFEVAFAGEIVLVEAETYEGLTLTGRDELVDRIAERVRARAAPAAPR